MKYKSISLSFAVIVYIFSATTISQAQSDPTPGCGNLNEPKCEFKEATLIKPNKPGCPAGTMEDLGQCWTCPSGYERNLLEPINSAKACAKGLFGPFAKANQVGKPATVCPPGYDFDLLANICFTCGPNYNRTGLPVTGPEACSIRADWTCDPGFVLDPFQKNCRPSVEDELEEKVRELIPTLLIDLVGARNFAIAVNDATGVIDDVIGQLLANTAVSEYVSEDEVSALWLSKVSNDRTYDYRTITVSGAGQAGAILTIAAQTGAAVDLQGSQATQYFQTTAKGGLGGIEASAGAAIGIWLIENHPVRKKVHGYSLSFEECAMAGQNPDGPLKNFTDVTNHAKTILDVIEIIRSKGSELKPGPNMMVTFWFENNNTTKLGEFLGVSVVPVMEFNLSFVGGYTMGEVRIGN